MKIQRTWSLCFLLRNISVLVLIALVVAAASCSGGSGSISKVNTSGGGSNPPGNPGPSGAVSISPASETLRIGGQRQFSGWDSTVGQYDVTWSLQEGAAAGTVTADGLYTAPGAAGSFHLIATSSHNPSLSAAAPLTIVPIGFVLIADMAIARSGHTATLLADGKVLVAGGTADAAHSAELFDPASGNFTPVVGAMVHARTGHCAILLPDGKVLIAGGGDASGNVFKTAELFDPLTQGFSATGDLNQARTGATATLLPNGKVLIAGGRDTGGTLLPSAELYDPGARTFVQTGSMHSPRAQHTATLLSNGKVLLVGSSSETASAELFDPASFYRHRVTDPGACPPHGDPSAEWQGARVGRYTDDAASWRRCSRRARFS